jgi:hypothetical protein
MTARRPYHAPALERLGPIEKLTQTDTQFNNGADGVGYAPGTAPPGS